MEQQQKIFRIEASKVLYDKWMALGGEHSVMAAVIQNDIEITRDSLNDWFVQTSHFIQLQKENGAPEAYLNKVLALREQTVEYLKEQVRKDM